jgi:hypothetical protein
MPNQLFLAVTAGNHPGLVFNVITINVTHLLCGDSLVVADFGLCDRTPCVVISECNILGIQSDLQSPAAGMCLKVTIVTKF